jgi:methionine synthase II (cobalamin-independent)
VTVLNWSFPRKDISRAAQAAQLAQALRREVDALQTAGCRVIQVWCGAAAAGTHCCARTRTAPAHVLVAWLARQPRVCTHARALLCAACAVLCVCVCA